MSEDKPIKTIQIYPKYLWFLILSYAMVIVLSNWFDPRLINIFGLNTDAGTLIFPLTFLLSDLITEVYGYKHARRAIWCGFLFNAIFVFYAQIIIHMPNPPYPTQNSAFDSILAMNARIIFASTISYLSSEPLNSFVMAKLKIRMRGKQMGLRFVLSTVIASATDSLFFGVIAFYGTMSSSNLLGLILTMWFFKVLIEIVFLPVSIRIAKKLKQTERLDIYDQQTNFNLFSLNGNYPEYANQFDTKS